VEQRSRERAARQDEPAKRRQLAFQPIDRLLETLDVGLLHRCLVDAPRDTLCGIGQSRTDGEQLFLDRLDRTRQVIVQARGPCDAEGGVQLVHLAVGADPGIRLRHARVVEQRRLAGITSLCVNLHATTPLDVLKGRQSCTSQRI
jgi:hypothetical protein